MFAFELACKTRESGSLHLTIDDLAGDAPGEPAVGDVQRAGDGMVETEPGLEPVGEEGEAAGNQQRLGAGASESGEHALGAGREPQALVIDACQRSRVESREQRDATLKALAEIDFAAHRAPGYRGDFRLDTAHVGDLVDALDTDQRRVHVHRDQPHALEALIVGHETEVDAGHRAQLGHAGSLPRGRQAERLRARRGERRDRVGFRQPRQLLDLRRIDIGSLDDEIRARHHAALARFFFPVPSRPAAIGGASASTKSIFVCSRSTRATFTTMRSASRHVLPLRSPTSEW